MSHGLLLVFEVTILVLAIFLGFEVISKVPTLLHTPLMSGTNAIHGIVIVGAMLVAGLGHKDTVTTIIGLVAVVLASANVVGGFVVTDRLHGDISVSIILSALIGSISFAGSMVAFGKLQELIQGRPIVYPGQQVVNALLLASVLAAGIAIVFGVLFVLPIGGADMPVVISLLNAFTGLAAAATGFELENNVLIVSGMLVGASGTLLTILMGRAMNRSIANVLFGAFGQVTTGAAAAAAGTDGGTVRSASADDVAVMLAYAHKVVFVPGYGMAVAQAQHDVRTLADLLEERGIEVSYAIHPVAGRMPGHMNVLLAEANVPYPQLKEMSEANPEFPRTDVALVIGANDVTNPDARSNKGSPIYGLPILNVDQAQSVVVLKRSMNPGFAGIENPLFLNPKTVMLFGDAKESIDNLIAAVKTL